MTGRVQTLRSNVAGNRPTGRQPGELYVNWADGQFGVISSAGAPQDLIAVTFYSTTASYAVGQFVIQAGQLYRCTVANAPGAFNPAQWSQIGGSVSVGDVAPANPQPGTLWWDSVGGQMYVWYVDPNTSQWVVANNGTSTDYLPLGGGTLTGPLTLAGNPVNPLDASPKQYVDALPVAMNDNRIINGDMRIDQRNNGVAGTALGYTVDRWQCGGSQTGKFSWQRNANPTALPGGCPYSLLITSSSAFASAAADTFATYQTIEADMVSDFAWGTANARPVTLSFWAGSNLTGTFSGVIRNAGNTRSYPFTFSIPVAGTWAQYFITIPGDTAGTWVMSGSAAALFVMFDLGSGATYRGPAGAWASANYTGATGAISVVATNGATFFLTGVKLEIGSIATPFNRQSLAKSLADCQRYYQTGQVAFAGFNTNVSANAYASAYFMATMRATPTLTTITNNNANFTLTSWVVLALGANGVTAVGVNAGTAGPITINMTFSASAEL
jgi:hypothetical protein